MFELVNTFWGGAVSFASGALAIYGAAQVISRRPRRLIFDFRSWSPQEVSLPDGFDIVYKMGEKDHSRIHIAELILKNETGSPLLDDSFIELPRISLGEKNVLCSVRKVGGIDDSRVSTRKFAEGSSIELCDVMIPIDSSVTIELVCELPIDKRIQCVHRDAKLQGRNYGVYRRSKELYSLAPFTLLPLIWGFAILSVGVELPNPLKSVYDLHRVFLPGIVSAGMIFLELVSTFLLAVFLYRMTLRASAAERRFTELKLYPSRSGNRQA